jgi:hypothetical protein
MSEKHKLAFGKKNYTIMLIGLAVLVAGFIIMTLDNTRFGFGFLGLTLSPVLIMIGFIIELFAILQKPENRE